jgi:hypothetical protein
MKTILPLLWYYVLKPPTPYSTSFLRPFPNWNHSPSLFIFVSPFFQNMSFTKYHLYVRYHLKISLKNLNILWFWSLIGVGLAFSPTNSPLRNQTSKRKSFRALGRVNFCDPTKLSPFDMNLAIYPFFKRN